MTAPPELELWQTMMTLAVWVLLPLALLAVAALLMGKEPPPK